MHVVFHNHMLDMLMYKHEVEIFHQHNEDLFHHNVCLKDKKMNITSVPFKRAEQPYPLFFLTRNHT